MMSEASRTRYLNPPRLATPAGYSQVVEVQARRLLFISGQAPIDENGALVGRDNISEQAKQAFRNMSIALESADGSGADLVKLTVYLRDIADLAAYRVARDDFFARFSPPPKPAITLVEVSGLFGSDFLIEIEGIAAV